MYLLTRKEEEAEDHDAGVAEVEEGGGGAHDVELGDEVVDTVDGQVEGGEAGGQETPPPPVIVLQKEVRLALTIFKTSFESFP